MEGHEFQTMEQTASTRAHVENTSSTETREYFSVYNNPLVQMPPVAGSSNWMFNHPPDETIEVEYGPNSPFCRTSLRQSIAEYGTTTTEPDPSILSPLRIMLYNAPSNE